MSEAPNVNHAFDPEARHAQAQADADWAMYLENRPYEDSNGRVHNPENNTFVNADSYFNEQRQINEETSQTAYEEMTMLELARELAQAEVGDDWTSAENITDALIDKMAEHSNKMTRKGLNEGEADDLLYNRVMGYKDKCKSELSGDSDDSNGDPDNSAGADPDSDQAPGNTSDPDQVPNTTSDQGTAPEADDSAETSNDRIKLDIGQAEKAVNGNNLTLQDDNLKLYGVFGGEGEHAKESSEAAAEAVQSHYNNTRNFPALNANQAIQDMRYAFEAATKDVNAIDGSTTATVVKPELIDGSTYAVIGTTGGSHVYRQDIHGDIVELAEIDHNTAQGYKFDAVRVRNGDRLLIASDPINMATDEAQKAFTEASPQDAADQFIGLSDEKEGDESFLVIDIEKAPGGASTRPDVDSPSIGTDNNSTLVLLDAEPSNNDIEDDVQPQKLNWHQRAMLKARNAAMIPFASRGKDKKNHSRKYKVARVGIGLVALGLAYRGYIELNDLLNDSDSQNDAPADSDADTGTETSTETSQSRSAIGDGSTEGLKKLTPEEIKEALKDRGHP